MRAPRPNNPLEGCLSFEKLAYHGFITLLAAVLIFIAFFGPEASGFFSLSISFTGGGFVSTLLYFYDKRK